MALAWLKAIKSNAGSHIYQDNETLTAEVNSGRVEIGRDGVTTQAGPPREIYSAPVDPWTAGFPGSANLLPGVLQNQGVRGALGWHEMRACGQLPGGGGEVTVLIRPEQTTLEPFAPSAERVTGKVLSPGMPAPGGPAPGGEVCLTAFGPVTAWPEGSF